MTKVKSICLVCRGKGQVIDALTKLYRPCAGCKSTGWIFVESIPVYLPNERPAPYVRKTNQNYCDSILFAIAKYQEAYLKTKDIKQLRPMRLIDISEIVKLDISTVCNHIGGAKIDGIPVKSLFSNLVGSTSSKVVKALMRDIIEEEDIDDTLSDQQLADKLEELHGIKISRRTVTKYRISLHIPHHRIREEK